MSILKIAWSPVYAHPLPAGHRFPMEKYELIPGQLIREGVISSENLFEPGLADEEVITAVHDPEYWSHLKNLTLDYRIIRAIGFPLSAELVKRERILVQGTVDCALLALESGVSLNIAGGTHHAFTNRGEGFCLLNDIAVAARYILQRNLVKKVLIADLDVHQGNGTAQIFKGDEKVFTFSMHGATNFPFRKEASDLDIALPDFTGGEYYLRVLRETLPRLIREQKPDFIFYNSGVDVLGSDKLGKLNLTLDECCIRDEVLFGECRNHGIPVAVAMGGGYSPKIADIVNAHCNTFKLAQEMFF